MYDKKKIFSHSRYCDSITFVPVEYIVLFCRKTVSECFSHH